MTCRVLNIIQNYPGKKSLCIHEAAGLSIIILADYTIAIYVKNRAEDLMILSVLRTCHSADLESVY